jgi:hypothetical protein
MVTLLVIICLIIAFDMAAWRWGQNSLDDERSAEWERRRAWLGRTGHR